MLRHANAFTVALTFRSALADLKVGATSGARQASGIFPPIRGLANGPECGLLRLLPARLLPCLLWQPLQPLR